MTGYILPSCEQHDDFIRDVAGRKRITFFGLRQIRPCSTALTMVAKLSSVRTIQAAPLATPVVSRRHRSSPRRAGGTEGFDNAGLLRRMNAGKDREAPDARVRSCSGIASSYSFGWAFAQSNVTSPRNHLPAPSGGGRSACGGRLGRRARCCLRGRRLAYDQCPRAGQITVKLWQGAGSAGRLLGRLLHQAKPNLQPLTGPTYAPLRIRLPQVP